MCLYAHSACQTGVAATLGAFKNAPPDANPINTTPLNTTHNNTPQHTTTHHNTTHHNRCPADHPFAQLQGSDNVVVFTTRRYSQTPLVVRGPGAGAEVTAAGVFGDILRLIRG